MTKIMKNWDIPFGASGFVATISIATVNQAMATVIALMTIFILSLRMCREWKNRNKPPEGDL